MDELVKAGTKVFIAGGHTFYDAGNVPGVLDEQDIVCYRDRCERVSTLDANAMSGKLATLSSGGNSYFIPQIRLGMRFHEGIGSLFTTTVDSMVGVPRRANNIKVDQGTQVFIAGGHTFYDVGNIAGALDEQDIVCYRGRCERVSALHASATNNQLTTLSNGGSIFFAQPVCLGTRFTDAIEGASVYTAATECVTGSEGVAIKVLGDAITKLIASLRENRSE